MNLQPIEQKTCAQSEDAKGVFSWAGTAGQWRRISRLRKALELQREMQKTFARAIEDMIHA